MEGASTGRGEEGIVQCVMRAADHQPSPRGTADTCMAHRQTLHYGHRLVLPSKVSRYLPILTYLLSEVVRIVGSSCFTMPPCLDGYQDISTNLQHLKSPTALR